MSRVDEIRARLAAITPGKWDVQDRHFEPRYVVIFANGIDSADGYTGVCQPDHARDVPFIAAAPEDISYLLERVEKLEGLLNAFAKHDNKHEKCWCGSVWSPHTEACIEARTLLADESKENEHGNK